MVAPAPELDSSFLVDPAFGAALLAWYRAVRRDLPWRRREDDAYAVWISEVMLQQTTVAAVVGFYERWMARFPTLPSLADAGIDDVLGHWAGLGYYSRARNIHKAARIVRERHGGRLPDSVPELLALPGIGRYTAGAIASIAYQRDAPILDANVVRVVSRLAALEGDAKTSAAQARLWDMAERIIPPGAARDFNQALMELGATLCSPARPSCAACPVARWCMGRAAGDPERYPAAPPARVARQARHAAVAVEREGALLLIRRPDDAPLWAGLWELPRAVAADGEPLEACAERAARETAGIEVAVGARFGSHRHAVTVTNIVLTGFAGQLIGAAPATTGAAAMPTLAWVAPAKLASYAISSPQRRLLELLARSRRQPSLLL